MSSNLFAGSRVHPGEPEDMFNTAGGGTCTDFSGDWEGTCTYTTAGRTGLPLNFRIRIEQPDCASISLGGTPLVMGKPYHESQPWGTGSLTIHALAGYVDEGRTELIENLTSVKSLLWDGYLSMETQQGYSLYKLNGEKLIINGFWIENSFWNGLRGDSVDSSEYCELTPAQGRITPSRFPGSLGGVLPRPHS